MLPRCRTEGDTYSIPKFDLSEEDLNAFGEELRGFHSQFSDCFSRSEPRENFYQYMSGQLSELERKSTEPIAIKIEGGKVRAMQHTISGVAWDEEKMIKRYRRMVNEDMGDPDGVLIFDESGFVKKGGDSAGVARQYCGPIGKVENCQVGVFAAYASPHGYALSDKRLFIPEKWFDDEYRGRRKKCGIPESAEFSTEPQQAVEMFQDIGASDDIPFKYIVADSIYGQSPDFIEEIDKCVGKIYMVSVSGNTLCRLKEPSVIRKTYTYKGKTRSEDVVKYPENKPVTVKSPAETLHSVFWYKRTVSEGTKGPIEYEFTKKEVILAKDGLPRKHVWLIIKRTTGDNPTYYHNISNAPVSARLKLFVWLSGIRWATEQCFEETETVSGMDHYEVRKFSGWNRHILTCISAHFFLWHIKIKLGKKNAGCYDIAAQNSDKCGVTIESF
jgi:SRSO17 transposase